MEMYTLPLGILSLPYSGLLALLGVGLTLPEGTTINALEDKQ